MAAERVRNCFECEAGEGEGEGEVASPFFARHKWRRKWFLRLTDWVSEREAEWKWAAEKEAKEKFPHSDTAPI